MGRRAEGEWGGSSPALAAARERGDVDRHFQKKLLVTRSLIDRLGLEKELHGHTGCVNCLEWNLDGSILASASDDLHVMLWDPFRYKQLHNIVTGHSGNIFSVKFQPFLLYLLESHWLLAVEIRINGFAQQ
ncbi:WD and tetratricopeptide repeats protein 1 [Eumeta japonica]|uniref:WD and tetratricopeptide repeats protein 1 n=1 Tax=Eumeta variegata TaxID=151549 RepID=A0A4C1VMS7_EUMVA|nr:WD and tetratricopeptide repeats protein 1 [Eumeta japonica]